MENPETQDGNEKPSVITSGSPDLDKRLGDGIPTGSLTLIEGQSAAGLRAALVLVDTPYTPEATKALLGWMETRFGARELIAINTGFHVDNLGGNSVLIEAGIPVYGAEETVALVEERGEDSRAQTLEFLKAPRRRS